jgi:N-succinyldiaminopimelate aminotransferase
VGNHATPGTHHPKALPRKETSVGAPSVGGERRPEVGNRLHGLGTTIFAEMSALAVATGSINLGQGFPDTDGPALVAEAAVRAIREGLGNQYPPGPGIPQLRHAVAAHQAQWYGLHFDPDTEVLITAGATEAIAAALLALVDPGDEVIAFEPYYDSYAACIAMAGGVRVPATLCPPTPGPPTPEQPRWHPDLDALAASITDRTRVLLLNSPHNPTGMVLDDAELRRLADLAIAHDLIVITDEVYEHLVFEGGHIPIATLPGMRERTVTISSSGKTFSFTGWKIGWVTGTPELVSAVRTAKQFLTYVSGGPFQYAVAEALKLPRDYYTEMRESLRARRDLLASGLAQIGFGVSATEGTYFITTDIRPLGADDGIAFCRALPERCGVVAIPNAVFYDDKQAGAPFVRFTFCKKPEVLNEALDRLSVLMKPR